MPNRARPGQGPGPAPGPGQARPSRDREDRGQAGAAASRWPGTGSTTGALSSSRPLAASPAMNPPAISPAALASPPLGTQQGPPEQHHGQQLDAIEHGQATVPGQGVAGSGRQGAADGGGALAWTQAQLKQADQGAPAGWRAALVPAAPAIPVWQLLEAMAAQLPPGLEARRHQPVQPRRLVQIGLAPVAGQEAFWPGAPAGLQGHPGHDPFVPVPQGADPPSPAVASTRATSQSSSRTGPIGSVERGSSGWFMVASRLTRFRVTSSMAIGSERKLSAQARGVCR